MKKLSLVYAGLAIATVLVVSASPAQAKSRWFFGVNSSPYWYGGPAYYYAPPPPPPAYYYYPGYYPRCYRPAPVGFSFGYSHR